MADWEKEAKEGHIEKAIELYINQIDFVTFAELEHHLQVYCEMKGHWALELTPNCFIWVNLSWAFCQAINELLENKAIFWQDSAGPFSAYTFYLTDGKCLTLPITKSIPKEGFKRPRWIPVLLRPIEKYESIKRSSLSYMGRLKWTKHKAEIVPEILERDGFRCVYCSATNDLTIDHIIPLCAGGNPTDPANLVVACRSCNSKKHGKTPEEAGLSFSILRQRREAG